MSALSKEEAGQVVCYLAPSLDDIFPATAHLILLFETRGQGVMKMSAVPRWKNVTKIMILYFHIKHQLRE